MTRWLVSGDLVLNPDGSLAQSTPFTLWSAKASGTLLTDITAPDGVSSVTLTTTPEGQRPELRLPDGIKSAWMDIGATYRQYIFSAEALDAKFSETAGSGGGSGGVIDGGGPDGGGSPGDFDGGLI